MVQETFTPDVAAAPEPPPETPDVEVADAAETQEEAASAQPLRGADTETAGAEEQEEGPVPTPDAAALGGTPLDVRHYASMLALQPESITAVPEELREEAKALSEQMRQNLMRDAETRAQQEMRLQNESQQAIARYRQHWDEGDTDTLNRLSQDEPEQALHFFADLYNRAVRRYYEKSGQPVPSAQAPPSPGQFGTSPQGYDEATARIIQAGQQEMMKLAGRPDAYGRITATYYSMTEQGLARLRADVEKELAKDPARARQAAQEARRGLPRPDMSPGSAARPGGLTADEYGKRLQDGKLPGSKEIDAMTRTYLSS